MTLEGRYARALSTEPRLIPWCDRLVFFTASSCYMIGGEEDAILFQSELIRGDRSCRVAMVRFCVEVMR
jgi:hypothetical protein